MSSRALKLHTTTTQDTTDRADPGRQTDDDQHTGESSVDIRSHARKVSRQSSRESLPHKKAFIKIRNRVFFVCVTGGGILRSTKVPTGYWAVRI